MPGPKSDKIWADAVRKAVHAYHERTNDDGSVEKIRNLNALATNLVAMARKGDITAIKEIGDRLDGKPGQAVAVSGEVKVTKVVEQFVMPDGTEDTDAPRIPTAH